ncbi:hypothetical protein STEG23_012531 [Scotinomys teguina]
MRKTRCSNYRQKDITAVEMIDDFLSSTYYYGPLTLDITRTEGGYEGTAKSFSRAERTFCVLPMSKDTSPIKYLQMFLPHTHKHIEHLGTLSFTGTVAEDVKTIL